MRVLLVVVGASIGAPARMLVGWALPGPRGTFVVNVLGSLLVGLFAGLPPTYAAALRTGSLRASTANAPYVVKAPHRPVASSA